MLASQSPDHSGPFFPLLSLPLEIRHLIYHEILSRRTIVLRDRMGKRYLCGRSYFEYHLEHGCYPTDNTISLLQLCKQVHKEAQPLLMHHAPSHLILSKDLNKPLSSSMIIDDLELEVGVPVAHITCITLNVKNLGENKKQSRVCPGLLPHSGGDIFREVIICSGFEEDAPPPDPKRLPNLVKIHDTLFFFSLKFPALREIHIYDVLNHSLIHPTPCTCPVAGTDLCTCGTCQCDCTHHPPLPNSHNLSLAQVRTSLYETLLSRFRAALYIPGCWDHHPCLQRWSDYATVLDQLAHGVNIFLHDEITVKASLDNDSHHVLHKGYWQAIYHLTPSSQASAPASPPTDFAETLRQRRLKLQQKNDSPRRLPHRHEREIYIDGDGWKTRDLRELPAGFQEGQPLVNFEAGLHLEIMDSHSFDNVIEIDSAEGNLTLQGARDSNRTPRGLWKWD